MSMNLFRAKFELEVNPRAKWMLLPLVTYALRHAFAPVVRCIMGRRDIDWISGVETALEIAAFASLVFVVYWWFHNVEREFKRRVEDEIKNVIDRIDENVTDQQVLNGLNRLVEKLLAQRRKDSKTKSTNDA